VAHILLARKVAVPPPTGASSDDTQASGE